MNFNTQLLELAQWRISKEEEDGEIKEAFIPPQAAGGTPDPSQAQAAAGATDPSALGGAPSGGGMPPGAASPDAMASGPGGSSPVAGAGGLDQNSLQQMITQTIQTAMAGGQGGMGGGMGKPPKPDIITVAQDTFHCKRLLLNLYNVMGISIPDDLILGPDRNPTTGAQMMPGQPGSTSDPNAMASSPASPSSGMAAQAAAGPAGGAGAGGAPGQGAMPPISPMQGAAPDQAKQSSVERMGEPSSFEYAVDRATALSALYKRLQTR